MPDRPSLRSGLLAGGAARMWEHVIRDSVPAIRTALPPESRVLEVGYGDGLLSSWLAGELGWRMVGLDVRPDRCEQARDNARRFGLTERLDFRVCRPSETRQHQGTYEAVFVKTVLYSSESLVEYEAWLDWILSVLRPGGIFVNFETGRANRLVQTYRRLRRRVYTDLCLYTGRVEQIYDRRFEILFRKHFGGLSQFLAPLPGVYELAVAVEERVAPRTADNCFAVSTVARKPG